MKQSILFPKTQKLAPKGADSVNHNLLVRAGFIDQLMAGSFTLLPLGLRVVKRINDIIREELNEIGAQELLMPLMHPKNIWNETGRWESAKEVMYRFDDGRGKEFALSFTHEEILLDLVRKHIKSYQDLPLALYHFSTKFRNEKRARSGILRGREFLMKDMYSLHADERDFWNFYEKTKKAYVKIFKRIGFDVKVVEAGGGVFTDNKTHEFQVLTPNGEDTIYYCDGCDWAVNKELFKEGTTKCPECNECEVKSAKSIEVGNIFPFGTYYSEKMHVNFADKKGIEKPMYFGSYGIGSTRVLGAWVEVSNDNNGIVWSKSIAPFDVHLLDITKDVKSPVAKKVYESLKEKGIEVLWDDRTVPAGRKFSDCDLIGIPIRLVVSEKTGNQVEWKDRNGQETSLFDIGEIIDKMS